MDAVRLAHGHRARPARDGAVAELASLVPAPAIRDAVRGNAAGVRAARAHLGEDDPAGDGCRREAFGPRPVAELALVVRTPAPGPVRGALTAAMTRADAHAVEKDAAGHLA